MDDQDHGFKRPFPALTPAQRYHFDVFGYVVIENALTDDETRAIREALYRLKQDFIQTGDPTNSTIRGSRITEFEPHKTHFTHVLETDSAILDYVTHPRAGGHGRGGGRRHGTIRGV